MDHTEEMFVSQTLESTLEEAMRSRSVSLEKLAQLTNISERYLRTIIKGDAGKLPSAPYMRGYLTKIAHVLNLDPGSLYALYVQQYGKKEEPKKRGGQTQISNAASKLTPKLMISIGVVLGLALVIYMRGSAFLGKPTVTLNDFEDNMSVSTSTFTVRGWSDPKNRLTINEEVIYPEESGTFEKEFTLNPGFNTFRIKAHGILGKELEIVRQVYLATTTKTAEPKQKPAQHVETEESTSTTTQE